MSYLLSVLRLYNQKKVIFFVAKMRETVVLQKLLTFFQQKIFDYFRY